MKHMRIGKRVIKAYVRDKLAILHSITRRRRAEQMAFEFAQAEVIAVDRRKPAAREEGRDADAIL